MYIWGSRKVAEEEEEEELDGMWRIKVKLSKVRTGCWPLMAGWKVQPCSEHETVIK